MIYLSLWCSHELLEIQKPPMCNDGIPLSLQWLCLLSDQIVRRNQNLLIWKAPKPNKHTMYKQTTDEPPNLKTPATMHLGKCAIYVQLVFTVTIDIIMVNKCGSKCAQTGGKHHNGLQNPLWPWTYILVPIYSKNLGFEFGRPSEAQWKLMCETKAPRWLVRRPFAPLILQV